jgi:hypothetical protein
VAHPKLPIIFVGSDDGRFFIFGFKIEYCPPPVNEEDEFSGDEDADNDLVTFTLRVICNQKWNMLLKCQFQHQEKLIVHLNYKLSITIHFGMSQ